jgi:hypothetical protein
MALIAGALHESGEQHAAQSDSLPVVRDGSGELNHTGLTRELDVAHDGDSPARERIDREQCLTGVVIDVHQAVELTLGHAGFGSAEPKVPRLVPKSSDRGLEQRAIALLDWAHVDDPAVAELESLVWSPDHAVVPRPFSRFSEELANSQRQRVAVDPERKLTVNPMSSQLSLPRWFGWASRACLG